MPNVRYKPDQIYLLRNCYHLLSNAELARLLGLAAQDAPRDELRKAERKVQELARRNGIKWRAENGAPQWRFPIEKTHTTRLDCARDRFAA